MTDEENWAPCRTGDCQHAPGSHEAVIIKPIMIDPPCRVLFEGTLGACHAEGCPCRMYLKPLTARERARQ